MLCVLKGAEVSSWRATIWVMASLSVCMLLAYITTVCLKVTDLLVFFCSGFLSFALPFGSAGIVWSCTPSSSLLFNGTTSGDQKVIEKLRAECDMTLKD